MGPFPKPGTETKEKDKDKEKIAGKPKATGLKVSTSNGKVHLEIEGENLTKY